jgi:hypothetical protein
MEAFSRNFGCLKKKQLAISTWQLALGSWDISLWLKLLHPAFVQISIYRGV